ncbi:MAG: transcription termination/antitermination protein NusG [Candidatus Dadabacteria bacterium]
METAKHWYAAYTKPRWEKKIAKKLEERGVETYCPLNKVTRQWSDRKKVVMDPVFKGYIFIHIEDAIKWEVKKVDGVLNYVYWNGKPAIIRDDEIETIKKFLNQFEDVQVEELKVDVNKKVRIKQGVLMNYQGIVIEVGGRRARVKIESMGLVLSASFDNKNLEIID